MAVYLHINGDSFLSTPFYLSSSLSSSQRIWHSIKQLKIIINDSHYLDSDFHVVVSCCSKTLAPLSIFHFNCVHSYSKRANHHLHWLRSFILLHTPLDAIEKNTKNHLAFLLIPLQVQQQWKTIEQEKKPVGIRWKYKSNGMCKRNNILYLHRDSFFLLFFLSSQLTLIMIYRIGNWNVNEGSLTHIVIARDKQQRKIWMEERNTNIKEIMNEYYAHLTVCFLVLL